MAASVSLVEGMRRGFRTHRVVWATAVVLRLHLSALVRDLSVVIHPLELHQEVPVKLWIILGPVVCVAAHLTDSLPFERWSGAIALLRRLWSGSVRRFQLMKSPEKVSLLVLVELVHKEVAQLMH